MNISSVNQNEFNTQILLDAWMHTSNRRITFCWISDYIYIWWIEFLFLFEILMKKTRIMHSRTVLIYAITPRLYRSTTNHFDSNFSNIWPVNVMLTLSMPKRVSYISKFEAQETEDLENYRFGRKSKMELSRLIPCVNICVIINFEI